MFREEGIRSLIFNKLMTMSIQKTYSIISEVILQGQWVKLRLEIKSLKPNKWTK